MKIYTRVESRWDSFKEKYVIEKRSHYYYAGEISYCGSGGGQSQESAPTSTTQTMISEPWGPQQTYLRKGFKEAQKLYLDSHPSLFPNSMVLPFSPETQTAQQLTTERALNGSPVQAAGNTQLQRTINGDYLNNPTVNGDFLYGGDAFNASVDAATRRIMPQIDSAFEKSGRFNSGLAKTAQTQAIADSFANQYGQERQLQENNFNAGRTNQLQGALIAPSYAAGDYNDIGALAGVGAQNEQKLQDQLNEQIYRYGYDQNINRDDLVRYMQLIQGNYGGSQSGTGTSSGGNVTSSSGSGAGKALSGAIGGGLAGYSLAGGGALGGAASGAATGTMISPGWGTAIGAGVGLLSSLL